MYQVLYRKYRPKCFADVYGQEHVTSTLKNEIENGRISHAYLFTGSRGTGKTSCAKILARAVNCQNSINGEPCNECEICKGLDNGSIYDVVEIDAASNNGVDNIRDLRDDVNYTPTRGKYRVYIIDEVHMLTIQAFNALLKTLEEPPAHAIFVLATTEVHKLPATILSRCQRFDFKRIQPETMAVRLKQVAGLEGFELDDDAAILIARVADGALRDGLSILDQCASRNKKVTAQLVSQVAGLAGRESMYQLSACVSNKDSNTAMSIISELYQNSYDMERLCVEMINHFRNFLVVKTVRKSRELVVCTDDEYSSIVDSSKNFTIEGVLNALDLLQNTLVSIKGGANARIEVEMAFVKLCEPKLDESISSLLDRISSVERSLKNPGVVAVKPVEQTVSKIEDATVADESDKSHEVEASADLPVADVPVDSDSREISPVAAETSNIENNTPQHTTNVAESQSDNVVQTEFMQWGEFMDILHKEDIALFGVLSGSKGFVRGDIFLIDSHNATVSEFIKLPTHSRAIKKALFEITGKKYRLGIFKSSGNQPTVKRDPLEDLINQAQRNVNIEFK